MWAAVLGYVGMCMDKEELGIMDIWWKCLMNLGPQEDVENYGGIRGFTWQRVAELRDIVIESMGAHGGGLWSVEGKWGTADDYLGSDRGMKVCTLGMAEYVGDVQGKYAMGKCSGMQSYAHVCALFYLVMAQISAYC